MSNSAKTIGVEFESVIASREQMQSLVKSMDGEYIKSITRDASVESNVAVLPNGTHLFLGRNCIREGSSAFPRTVTGYELVSNPLSMGDMRRMIKQVTAIQAKSGEIFSDRSSIHIHTGYPNGTIFLRTALAMGLRVEPLLFKIAGMGGEFRGLQNHSAYCRPLALPPAVCLSDTSRFAVLSPEDAILTPVITDFWGKLGIRYGDKERYNPLRYFAINVFSVTLRGTLEFRFFNFSTISRYVEGISALCQSISDIMQRISLSTALSMRQTSIFEYNRNDVYNSLLDDIIYLSHYYNCEFKMEGPDIDSLRELIDITPQPVFEKKEIASHIKAPRICLRDAQNFGLHLVDSAKDPGIVDIHTFADSERSLI